MITNRGPEQEQGGDRFYARGTNNPPQLLIDLIGGNAADITISIDNDDVVNERPGNLRFIDSKESNSTDNNGIGDADSDSDVPLL